MEKKEIIKKENLIDYKKCKEELKEILEKLKHETFLKDIKEENFNLEYINLLYKYETGNAYKILIDRGPLPTIGTFLPFFFFFFFFFLRNTDNKINNNIIHHSINLYII